MAIALIPGAARNKKRRQQRREDFCCFFGVQDRAGQRSALWRVWAGGKNGNDVFLSPLATRDLFKVSLHESGDWRIAYDYDYSIPVRQFGLISSRVVERIHRPSHLAGERGVWRAVRMYLPGSQLTASTESWPLGAIIIEGASAGPPRVVDLYITDSTTRFNKHDWPFEASLQGTRVCAHRLENGEMMWLVSFLWPAAKEEIDREIRWFQAQPSQTVQLVEGLPVVDAKADRLLIAGTNPKGWFSIIDAGPSIKMPPYNALNES